MTQLQKSPFPRRCAFLLFSAAVLVAPLCPTAAGEPMNLTLRYQQETGLQSGRFHVLHRQENWKPEETAIIVCDVWDLHHCRNAVLREEQLLPRLEAVLQHARGQGATIIHSPSDCMPAYENHPARQRAQAAPQADFVPYDCKSWCSVIPSEERGAYPIDQSDGGEDDDPAEHAEWASQLKAMGRNPAMPWKKQADGITIDGDRDYISDRGDEVWNILNQRGIRNVILTGVHTNMCVLGRPFGLRQMARNGMNVVLMRDLTDTMYNPKRWPYVSHFTGTDLIVSHIERYVCPTVTSDQLVGGTPLRFNKDTRPHLVMLIAEDEYLTETTLPQFAAEFLGRDFRVTQVFGSETDRNSIPGIDVVREADVLLVSIRRRVLPTADLELVREFVRSGKPVVGIRTASHAFSLRNQEPPAGFSDWPEFDAEVFGGNYHGHHPNDLPSVVEFPTAISHPILSGTLRSSTAATTASKPPNPFTFPQGGSLYETSPLKPGTTVLATGRAEGVEPEPVAWTFTRADRGRSFYTSLGHVDDFASPVFPQLLYHALCWSADISPSAPPATDNHWQTVQVPHQPTGKDAAGNAETTDHWYRCAVRLPASLTTGNSRLTLSVPGSGEARVWVNGRQAGPRNANDVPSPSFDVPMRFVQHADANLIAVRVSGAGLAEAPTLHISGADHDQQLLLSGRWQFRSGGDESLAGIPLPAKFGASADVVFTAEEPLWTARPVTASGLFTTGIEGPACDPDGNILAVNYLKQGTIGRVSPNGSSELFVQLPEGSIGNGIRFDSAGNFYVADYTGHNVLKVSLSTRKVTTLAHNDAMNQPNDLAIAPDGTLYASDPAWNNGTGQIWRIDPDGTTTLLASDMGTTNGIEVSPDGKTLYVNESVQRNVWAFDITDNRQLADKRLIRRFDDFGFDGMRCDIDGNLYITRHGKGTVIRMSPTGEILQEVPVLGTKPTNLCFGGPDGCTVYVTEVDGTRLVSFRTDRPGRSHPGLHPTP